MSEKFLYTIPVSGTAESVDLFQRDIMDQEWYIDMTFTTSADEKDYALSLNATKGNLIEALDKATTNRDLVARGPIEVAPA